MHMIENMKNFLMDQAYYIDLFNNNIHVYHYIDILVLKSERVELLMEEFTLEIDGKDMVVKKLAEKEILIEGLILNVRLKR